MTRREKVFIGILFVFLIGAVLGQGRQGIPASLEAALYVDVGGDTMTGALVMPDGTVGAPAITGSDADSGFYWTLNGKAINVGVDGVNAFTVTGSDVRFLAGSPPTTPSIVISDSDTGFAYSPKGKAVALIVDGILRAQFDSTGIVADTGIICNGTGDFSGGTFTPPTRTVHQHLEAEAASKGKASSPPAENEVGIFFVWAFDSKADEEIFDTWEFPENYSNGTDLKASVLWAPSDASAGTATWGLEYLVVAHENGESLAGATTTQIVTDDSLGVADDLQESGQITISGTGVTSDDVIGFRIFRDGDASESGADDDYGADANFVELHLQYTADAL